jgi:hypothetical protein
MLPTAAPLAIYTDAAGLPLDSGYIYFGLPNQNPETAPITVYWDAAGTLPAAQPLRTSHGFVMRNGTRANVFVLQSHSVTIRDKNRALVTYMGVSETLQNQLAQPTGSTGIGLKRSLAGAVATTLQRWIDGQVVNVKAEYCADGIYSTAKIQSAIDDRFATGATGCGVVFLAAGTWDMSANGGLTGYSNLALVGEGDATVLDYSAQASGNMFTANGTYGTEIPISAELDRYDAQVSTTTAHSAAVGDWYAIKSQRNALSVDGGEWQLGLPTGSNTANYYTEIFQVETVVDSDTFDFEPALVFPKYRQDATQETDPYARAAATIAKIGWIQGIVIRDMKVIAGSGTNRMHFQWAKDCLIENVTFDMGIKAGVPLYFRQSYSCQGKSCKVFHSTIANINSSNLATFNTFKIISGWYCGFEDCESVNGSQPFDITYANLENPSLFSRIKRNRVINSEFNAITSHSGSYGVSCTDNDINGCKFGPSMRSRNMLFSGNSITGQGGSSSNKTYGLSMTDGWTIDSIVDDNTIEGFYYAIYATDFNSAGFGFVQRKTMITANHLSRCEYGLYYNHDDVNYKTAVATGFVFRGNFISKCELYGVYIDKYLNNNVIEANVLYGPMGSSGTPTAIYCADDSVGQIVRNNQLLNLGANVNGIRLGDIVDTVTFPAATYPTPMHVLSRNNFYGLRNSDYNGTFVCPDTVYFGITTPARTYSPNTGTAMLYESGVVGQSMIWSMITDNTSTGWIMVGDQDGQLRGGFNYNNATDTLTLRTAGASQVSLTSALFSPSTDNARTLGDAVNRWSVVYAATGAINTSDERAKVLAQNIEEAAIRAIHKVNFKQFKFADAVAAKGGAARWHFGVIAQQVKDAFESEGLDAFAYGLLCYDEWPEQAEVLGEDGSVEQEYRAAGNRYGVRYDELLCLKMASL